MRWLPLAGLLVAGCGRPAPAPVASPPPPRAEGRFDPATAGTVRGRVQWNGPVPAVSDLPAAVPDGTAFRFTTMPHPFAPRVQDGGLGGAVVSLVGMDPGRAKPWPFPPATVEQAGHQLRVRQGDDAPAAVGFARVGDAVTVLSRDTGPATVRLRGAAFSTLPFPGPDRPLTRRFDTPGVVEVTSGTMLAWAACDLVVSDHPYHALTDAGGRFELTGVPPGAYQLACRVRDWHEAGTNRDPETGLVSRRRFAPPLERTTAVRVSAGGLVEVTFTVLAEQFGSRDPSPKR